MARPDIAIVDPIVLAEKRIDVLRLLQDLGVKTVVVTR